jgi:hypothetical protein
MTSIVIEYSDAGLFGDTDPETENINVMASHDEFERQVTEAMQAEYPGVEVVFEFGLEDSHAVDGQSDTYAAGVVGDIMNEVWNKWEWVVEN